MMNNNVVVPSLSECSSGCESGWTLYLDHSTSNFSTSHKNTSFSQEQQYYCTKNGYFDTKQEYEYECDEEDLSMVSDASSGPPHFDHDIKDEDDNLCYNNVDNGGIMLKKRSINLEYEYEMQCCNVVEDIALDDSASSHVILASKKIGGIHVQNDEIGASLERLIDYSTQGYSTTHFQGSSSNFQKHLVLSNLNSRKKIHHQHNQ